MSAPAFVPMVGARFVDRLPKISYRPDDLAAHRAGWDSIPRTHARGCPDILSCAVCQAEIHAAADASVAATKPLGVFEALRYGENARFSITTEGARELDEERWCELVEVAS